MTTPPQPPPLEVSPEKRWPALIRGMARGDQSALSEFYDETSRLVFALALRMLNDRGAAEEVTLDVYWQVWRQAQKFDPARGTPLAWLMTIARSRAIDRLRSAAWTRHEKEPLEEARAVAADTHSPEDVAGLTETRQLIRRALDQLSPEQREVIEVAYFGGLSHQEIALKLGLPLGTVKTRIRSGMMKLRELLPTTAGNAG
ncbi:MAG TPA: sigma-70 family RNA polymerase sigma factor [Blastocatellia bacterium]|nr:sigma-70 family RNA polymerase sigma factor [Blastocatellia bacterium]